MCTFGVGRQDWLNENRVHGRKKEEKHDHIRIRPACGQVFRRNFVKFLPMLKCSHDQTQSRLRQSAVYKNSAQFDTSSQTNKLGGSR